MMASISGYEEYKIGGVSVYFPCKPYPSQFSMMDKIIKGLERRQHCLLESPTGSGKSLALLCSALAWQRAEREKRSREEEAKQKLLDDKEEGKCSCSCSCHTAKATKNTAIDTKSSYFPTTGACTTPMRIKDTEEDEDDDFKDDMKSFRTPGTNLGSISKKLRKHVSIHYEDSPSPGDTKTSPTTCCQDVEAEKEIIFSEDCQDCDCANPEKTKKRKIPKIYFGTRTHKQVSQIVRELKKTAYHDVNMTILGSREHTCIHPEVSRMANKNEGCKDLLKGPGCRMKDRAKSISTQDGIRRMGLTFAWDLEDMVSMCKKRKACPYFLTRALKDQSDIIICPYNYLVDPIIRESMEILLKDQIIILDEAHNIEDSAREAGSQSVKQEATQKAIQELHAMINGGVDVAESIVVKNVMEGLDQFLDHHKDNLDHKEFDSAYKIWSGFDIVAQMKHVGLGPTQIQHFGGAIKKLCEEKEDVVRDQMGNELKLSSPSMTVIEQLLTVLDYLYRNDMKYVEDYRLSIVKATTFVFNQATTGKWLNPRQRHGGQRHVPVVTCTLNFWCLNPAVAFSDFQNCRTVVLSSGTLSPMSSFSSELGMVFSIQLEANHVIKDNQVWVGAIGQGPSGTSLQAVYRNIETFKFQDELGHLVSSVCQTVPHGVLCFFPSYNCLDKLSKRWKDTGLWDKIVLHKKIVAEPRGSDKMNFEELMKLFYDAVEEEDDERDGALFLAVCRGKVSEGLDFADNFARAVITVGIPYPNFKDVQVDLKKKYNDQHREARGLLSGSEWYEIQAYRALNQALGRCIRHRKDWGALILVDERFVKNPQKYHKGLSKWVRNKAVSHNSFHEAMTSLSKFTQQRIEAAEHEDADISIPVAVPTTPQLCQQTSFRTPLQDKFNTSLPQHNSLCKPQEERNNTPIQQTYSIFTPLRQPLTDSRLMSKPAHGVSTPVTLTPDLGLSKSRRHSSAESIDLKDINKKIQFASNDTTEGRTNHFCDINENQTLAPSLLREQIEVKKERDQEEVSPTASDFAHNTSGEKMLSDKKPLNKFFKFCKVPESKRSSLGCNGKSEEFLNKDSSNIESKSSCEKELSKASIVEARSASPELFETNSDQDLCNFTDSIKIEPTESESSKTSAAKKPLFRRKSLTKHVQEENISETLKTIKTEEKDLSEDKGQKVKVSEVNGHLVQDEVKDVSEDMDDLEGLMVKRRSSRQKKRKSDINLRTGSKRKRGVDFLDELKEEKSKKSGTKHGQCTECGKMVVSEMKDFELRKRIPSFLKSLSDKSNTDVVFLPSHHQQDNLQICSAAIDNGLTLNSHYDEASGTVVQYIRCGGCEGRKVIGCRVVQSNDTHYKAGQMWLFHNQVKIV